MRRREPNLLLTFGALALVAVAALGVVLGSTLESIIERRACENAEQTSQFVADVAIRAYLSEADIRDGISPARTAVFDGVLAGGTLGPDLSELRIWAPDGRTVYSSAGVRSGTPGRLPPAGAEALRSRTAHSAYEEDAGARSLVVHVPILETAGRPPAGVLELAFGTGAISRQVAADVRRLRLVLAGGLALLYGLLFPIVVHASRQLRHQASRDALTEIANRRVFYDRLEAAVASGPTGVLIVDLDGFKTVNDERGHAAGDEVLRLVAARLAGAVRAGDTLARIGGDEFGIVAPLIDTIEAERLAQRLLAALSAPLVIEGRAVQVRASVGAAVAPRGAEPDDLPRLADAAMYRAKASGGGLALSA